jgi:putative ATPase
LACAPKSNAVYNAFNQAMAYVKSTPSYDVPLHLRNAPTELMKTEEYGAEYRYAHDEPEAFAAGERYLPQEIAGKAFYHPTDRGLEIKISEKLRHLEALDLQSLVKRYEG